MKQPNIWKKAKRANFWSGMGQEIVIGQNSISGFRVTLFKGGKAITLKDNIKDKPLALMFAKSYMSKN